MFFIKLQRMPSQRLQHRAPPHVGRRDEVGMEVRHESDGGSARLTVSYGHKRRRWRALLQGLKGNCGERL